MTRSWASLRFLLPLHDADRSLRAHPPEAAAAPFAGVPVARSLESNPALISGAWRVADDPEAQRATEETVMQASMELQQLRRFSKGLVPDD